MMRCELECGGYIEKHSYFNMTAHPEKPARPKTIIILDNRSSFTIRWRPAHLIAYKSRIWIQLDIELTTYFGEQLVRMNDPLPILLVV